MNVTLWYLLKDDGCSKSPCLNGGSCILDDDMLIKCTCTSEFTGAYCERIVRPCDENPCLNEGFCIDDKRGQYTCVCNRKFFT